MKGVRQGAEAEAGAGAGAGAGAEAEALGRAGINHWNDQFLDQCQNLNLHLLLNLQGQDLDPGLVLLTRCNQAVTNQSKHFFSLLSCDSADKFFRVPILTC